MVDELIAGLKNAISRGESLEKAKKSLINAGYDQHEVDIAASNINQAPRLPTTDLEIKQTLSTNAVKQKESFFSRLFEIFENKKVETKFLPPKSIQQNQVPNPPKPISVQRSRPTQIQGKKIDPYQNEMKKARLSKIAWIVISCFIVLIISSIVLIWTVF